MTEKPNRRGCKSTVAPTMKARGRRKSADQAQASDERRATRSPRREQGVLSPVQLRVLDAMMDPRCSTRADVAHLAGVREMTISKWMLNHPAFVDEYQRRVRYRGDEIAGLNVEAVRLALEFHIEVLRNKDRQYTTEDRRGSAKAILDLNRPRIDALSVQQVTVTTGSAPQGGSDVPASVRRFQAQGMSLADAFKQDATEMVLTIQQIAAGALQVGDPNANPTVIDGEVEEVEDGPDR